MKPVLSAGRLFADLTGHRGTRGDWIWIAASVLQGKVSMLGN